MKVIGASTVNIDTSPRQKPFKTQAQGLMILAGQPRRCMRYTGGRRRGLMKKMFCKVHDQHLKTFKFKVNTPLGQDFIPVLNLMTNSISILLTRIK